jgi:hypothetical protein
MFIRAEGGGWDEAERFTGWFLTSSKCSLLLLTLVNINCVI